MPFETKLTKFHKVAALSELPDGEMIGVMAEGLDVMLARIGDEYFAIYNNCSHAEAMLNFGTLHPGTCEVECPLHGGYFDLRTGEAVQEPPEDPVEAYTVRVEGDDIWVGPKE